MALSLASALDILRTLIGPRVTFCRIVLWANRLNDWNTMPTSARSRARALPSAGRGTPSMVIVPEVHGSRRLMQRIRVDLPDPDGPMTISTSPRSTVRSMSWRTCRSPKNLLTLSTTTRGVVEAGGGAGSGGGRGRGRHANAPLPGQAAGRGGHGQQSGQGHHRPCRAGGEDPPEGGVAAGVVPGQVVEGGAARAARGPRPGPSRTPPTRPPAGAASNVRRRRSGSSPTLASTGMAEEGEADDHAEDGHDPRQPPGPNPPRRPPRRQGPSGLLCPLGHPQCHRATHCTEKPPDEAPPPEPGGVSGKDEWFTTDPRRLPGAAAGRLVPAAARGPKGRRRGEVAEGPRSLR